METVSWTTAGASSSISVTVAACVAISQQLPHSCFRQLLNLLEDPIALEPAESIDEETSIEMVDLMRQRASHQLLPEDLPLFAVPIDVANGETLRPLHRLHEIGDREAAFLLRHVTNRLHNLGIDQHVQLAAALSDREIDDRQ